MATYEETKEFAQKYAGREVLVVKDYPFDKRYMGLVGRIAAARDVNDTYGPRILIEVVESKEPYKSFDVWETHYVIAEKDIKFKCFHFPVDYLKLTTPPITVPDDCDTCGAKGNDPCATTCPNRV